MFAAQVFAASNWLKAARVRIFTPTSPDGHPRGCTAKLPWESLRDAQAEDTGGIRAQELVEQKELLQGFASLNSKWAFLH